MARTSRLVVLLAAVTALAGCSGGDGRKPVFPVSGSATFGGEPMAGAMISFHPLNDPDPRALRAQATADKNGRYTLTSHATGDGAPAGEYAVTIYWPARPPKGKAAEPDEDIRPDRLRRAHADPKTTKLRATVRAQPNTLDFTLPK